MIPTETLKRLEFDKVLKTVARNARSQSSCRCILEMRPLSDAASIHLNWQRIEEIRGLARQRITLRIRPFEDIRPLLEQLRPEGAILAPLELLQFIPVLGSLDELTR